MNRTLLLTAAVLTLVDASAYAQSAAYPAPVSAAPVAPPRAADPSRPSIPIDGASAPNAASSIRAAGAVTNPKLRDELLAMRDESERIRREWIAHPKDEAIPAELKALDEQHVARLTAIIDQVGWPTIRMVGPTASTAAGLIMQQAPLAVQEKYLDIMKSAAANRDLSWALVATAIDRVRIGQGRPQLYGTQYDTTSGHFGPLPIEDPANLEARRREAGMTTMAEYDAALRRGDIQPAPMDKRPIGPAPNVNPH
jgi:hypothetical protein